jgi:branched-chain amino acid transport system substrate-binding protein
VRENPLIKRRLVAMVSIVAAVALLISACSSSSSKGSSSTSAGGGSAASSSGSSAAAPTGAAFKVGLICQCTSGLLGGQPDPIAVIHAWESFTNANGGINGHPVDVVTQSEPGNPGVALNDVKDLVGQGIIALIDYDTANDAAFTSYAESTNIPIFAGPFGSPAMTLSKNAFSTGVSENYLADEIILAVKKAGASKLAILYCAEEAVCAYEVDPLKAAAAKYGGVDVVFSASVLQAAPNYTAQCLEAKQKGADAMFIADGAGPTLAVAASCAQQGYTPHQVSDDGAYGQKFAGAPGMDGLIATEDNWPFFDQSIAPAKAMHTALDKYAPGITTNALFGETVVVEWTLGLLITAAAEAGKVGSTNPMTPAALFDGVYAASGTTLGGMTPPLTFKKGQSNENMCWFWVGITNAGKFGMPYGTAPACAPAHPAAASS